MATIPVAKIGVTLKLESGRNVVLFEGDIVRGLYYQIGDDMKSIDGTVRVINATVKNNFTSTGSCPPEPYLHKALNVTSLVIDSSAVFDAELTKINVNTIVDIDTVEANGGAITIGNGSQYKSLTEVIEAAPAGATVELLAGEYTEDLVFTKSVSLVSTEGAEIHGKMTFGGSTAKAAGTEKIDVKLVGLTLTAGAIIEVGDIDSFTMTGCKFLEHDLTAKTMPISFKAEKPMLIHIDNNEFGPENQFSYNLIDVYAAMKAGSSISGNTFMDDCCTHNQISLYGVDDHASIEINDNICAMSRNMVRFGFKGTPNCVVEMSNNTYYETDVAPWDGLFLVQPYGKQTESFADTTIMVNKTKKPEGQVCYLFAGTNDTPFTDDNKPTIVVDGEIFDAPISE